MSVRRVFARGCKRWVASGRSISRPSPSAAIRRENSVSKTYSKRPSSGPASSQAPPRKPVSVAADDLDASVGRRAVEDDVLDRLVVLHEHGLDRLFEELRLVVRGRHDADERPAHRPNVALGNGSV